MTKKTNPYDFSYLFSNFDPAKLIQNFDPTRLIQDFTSTLGEFKVPGMDMDAMLDSQRKNMEALTAANRQALEGMQTIAERQRELFQQAMDEANNITKELATSGNPQDLAQKQSAVMQQAFEKAFAAMRELAEMTAKTNQQTFDTLNKRFQESLAELRETTGTGKH